MHRGTNQRKRITSRWALVLLAALLLAALLPTAAQATTLLPMSLEELSRVADRVVVVTVGSSTPRAAAPAADGRPGYIETVSALEVSRVIKGVSAPQFALAAPGGTVDGVTMTVAELPTFSPGETCLLFLDSQGRVLGGRQGKLAVANGRVPALGQTLAAVEERVARAAAGLAPPAPSSDNVITFVLSTPVISGVSPGSASAGTGSQVTVSGSSFGATQGTGKVEFFYKSGSAKISAPIISWSDTAIVCVVPTAQVDGYPASTGTGPVTVTNSSGLTSAGYTFAVTFGYGGSKWASPACSYRVYPSTSDTTNELALVQGAATTWSQPSAFRMNYAGTCTSTNWTRNNYNDVFWSSSILQQGVLAAACTWSSGGTIVEVDTCFNDYYSWGDGSANNMDIQTISTHEMGHWLNLRDLYGSDSAKVMYGFGSTGLVKRTLHADDVAGIVWIYGGGSVSDTTPPQTTSDAQASYASSATIHLSATDAGSGVDYTTHNLDSAGWVTGTVVTTSALGDHTLQYYSVDVAGNTEPTHTVNFQVTAAPTAPVRYEQTDPRLTYSGTWTTSSSSLYSGGSYRYTTRAGAAVTIAFTGTRLDLIGRKTTSAGIARVILDGDTIELVDLYSAKSLYKQVLWSKGDLTDGAHTVRIEYTGTRNAKAYSAAINIDAVDVIGSLTTPQVPPTLNRYEQTSTYLRYINTWTSGTGSLYSGSSYRFTTRTGAAVVLAFNGTRLDWIGRKGVSSGIALVTLDDRAAVPVDLYNPTTLYKQVLWSTGPLEARTHTIRIEFTGTKNLQASSPAINIDAVDVLGTLVTVTL